MKLRKAFKKYDDNTILRRKSYGRSIGAKKRRELIKIGVGSFPIKFLKKLDEYATQKTTKKGLSIQDHMIEDAEAQDWEVVK